MTDQLRWRLIGSLGGLLLSFGMVPLSTPAGLAAFIGLFIVVVAMQAVGRLEVVRDR